MSKVNGDVKHVVVETGTEPPQCLMPCTICANKTASRDVPPGDSSATVHKPVATPAEKLCLFSKNYQYIHTLSKAQKYLLYAFVDMQVQTLCNATEADVDASIGNIDFLTFNWKLLPKTIFLDVFHALDYSRLAFLCGYFRCYYAVGTDRDSGEKMREALWLYFQGK